MIPAKLRQKVKLLSAEGHGPTHIARMLPVTFHQAVRVIYKSKDSPDIPRMRKELVANSTEEFILSRNEIRRLLSTTALEGLQSTGSELIEVGEALKAVQELNKMDGHYTPEQGADRLETGRALAHKVMLSDPAFAEFLRDEAAVINAKSGRVHEIQEAAAEVATRQLSPEDIAERERLAKEEDEAMELILGDEEPAFDGGYIPEGSSKRELTINLHR